MTQFSTVVILVFMLSPFIQGQSNDADLKRTLQWMSDTLPNHAYRFENDVERDREASYWSYGNPDQCDVKINIKSRSESVSDHKVWLADSDVVLSLRDIDPKSIETTDGEVVFAETTNERARILCHTRERPPGDKDFGPNLPCQVQGSPSMLMFRFDGVERAYGKRFSKALHLAVELCGGKPSPF